MFYTNYNVLFIAAVLPGLLLAFYINRLDKIESEPLGLLVKLFVMGIISVIPVAIVESIAIGILGTVMSTNTVLYVFLETFFCVACVEEGGKYVFLKKTTWKHPAFNYRFDAIVYAACVGIGFAVCENVQYVFSYGFGVAVLRAITAVPGHTIFGIYMGHYYGEAKKMHDLGDEPAAKALLKKAFWVPVLIHGFYDFAASLNSGIMTLVFWIFIIVLNVKAWKQVRKDAREDTPV